MIIIIIRLELVGGYFVFVENKTTEFKREYVEDIKNTIVAFANCDGGTLYIGVNDDGIACGVNNVDDTMLRVTNVIRDTIRPDITMFAECRNDVMNEKPIVCVTVTTGLFNHIQDSGICCRNCRCSLANINPLRANSFPRKL